MHQPLRILDASLNRASEGLRVVEDYARFVLDDAHLTRLAKEIRHDLGLAAASMPRQPRLASRDTLHDTGASLKTPSEGQRSDAWEVCTASLKRVEQSLRSAEEYGKLLDATFSRAIERLRYRAYTLEKALGTTRWSLDALRDCRLYALLDGQESLGAFQNAAEELVSAGVGAIQLRDKSSNDSPLVDRARALVRLTRDPGVLAIVNDRPDIARVAQADGVHLGQDDLSVSEARAVVGPDRLIGVSTHTLEQARQAALEGANYLGAGPTFPSSTKSFDTFAGLDFLKLISNELRLPVFAIGGIDASNLPRVLEAGVSRIAVGGAILDAENRTAAVQSLQRQLDRRTTLCRK